MEKKNKVIPDGKSIVILFEGDTHNEVEGYARFAGLRDALRRADDAHVMTVCLGDFMTGGALGAISKGGYIIDIMQSVGYDVLTLGNHEFDYGADNLKQLLLRLGVPVTCANFFACGATEPQYAPYVVRQAGTRRIAFVGALTPETMLLQQQAFYDEAGHQLYDVRTAGLYSLVQQAADKARRDEGADLVVALSHLGEKEAMGVSSHALIAATRGIDAVIDSHSHTTVAGEWVCNADGKPVLVTQAGDHMRHVGQLTIAADGTISSSLVRIGDIACESRRVKEAVGAANSKARSVADTAICTSDYGLAVTDTDGQPLVQHQETNGGDLVADAFRIGLDADIAMHSGNSFVKSVPAGRITYGDIVAMLPYEDCMNVIRVTGRQLLDVLTRCTQLVPADDGHFPQVSGIRFTVHVATHTVSDVEVLDRLSGIYKPLDPRRTYTVALSAYYKGGGFHGLLKDCPIERVSTLMVRDVVIHYLKDTLAGSLDDSYRSPQGRIRI